MLLAICLAAPVQADEGDWDLVVVGAGLSGLAAADALSDKRILVLEREAAPGGRAATRSRDGISCELGALVPPDPALVPGFEPDGLLETPQRLGVAIRGGVIFGASMDAVAGNLPDGAGAEIAAFAQGRIEDPTTLAEPAREIVAAAARLLFLTDLEATPAPLARMALGGLPGRAFAHGYRELVEHLGRNLEGRLRTSAEVVRILSEGDSVRVLWRRGGWEHESLAKAVIVATGAPAVAGLVADLSETAAAGLAAQTSAAGITVALGIRDLPWPAFTTIYIPGRRAHAVLRHPGPPQDGVTMLYVYYGDTAFRALSGEADDAIIEDALATLRSLDLGPVTDDALVLKDLRRWPHAIPCPRAGAARPPWPARARAAPRIWLAGDHVG
ncbi:MAG: FAD-dependent oxidoreductase, partial [Pseudomonadota bacterium]